MTPSKQSCNHPVIEQYPRGSGQYQCEVCLEDFVVRLADEAAKHDIGRKYDIERLRAVLNAEINRLADETEDTRELFNQVGQLLSGWKQGCTPAEWSDWDEHVLQRWQAWRSDDDPTPWCYVCGAVRQAQCRCPPIADNE